MGPVDSGKVFELNDESKILELGAGGYAQIQSLEVFALSEKVLGVFGQISDFARRGLQLVHSPFLDPLFDGRLELGLWNHGEQTLRLNMEDLIGKVAFFDISDTYPVTRPPDDSILGETFNRRRSVTESK